MPFRPEQVQGESSITGHAAFGFVRLRPDHASTAAAESAQGGDFRPVHGPSAVDFADRSLGAGHLPLTKLWPMPLLCGLQQVAEMACRCVG
jgi:hypothetical protein